jgi:endonuclease G
MQRGFLISLAGVVLALTSTSAFAESRNCKKAEAAAADRQLWLNARDKKLSISTNLPWGEPRDTGSTNHERTLVQRDYVIHYDDDLLVPIWTAEKLDASRIGKEADRVNCFRPDPRIPAAVSASNTDYDEPIYDRGHSTPDADQDSSLIAALNTYMFTNMSPQTCRYNRGIWQIFEGIVRHWAKERGILYVVSGSVFDRDGDGHRDADSAAPRMEARNKTTRVAVPSAFYKIVTLKKSDGTLETVTILMPHNDLKLSGDKALEYLQDHVTTVAAVEGVTGLDFFPTGSPNLNESSTFWSFAGRMPTNLCTT